MSSTVTIEQVKLSASGKSLSVRASGKSYFAKKDSGLIDKLGWTIEAETEESQPKDGGRPFVWITKWKKASEQPQTAALNQSQHYEVPQPLGPSNAINLAFLPFVSNCVAHAIQSGQCDGPASIQAWADAAYTAACNLKNAAE